MGYKNMGNVKKLIYLAAILAIVASPALAATAPDLGTAQSYGVLGASAVSNTGPSVVNGDLGISPNTLSSVTGFSFSTSPGAGIVTGATHFHDAQAIQAQSDATAAYTDLSDQTCGATISADLGGQTLVPGVYCSGSSMGLTGTLTLDAQGDPNAVWVFQMGSTLTTASGSSVVFKNNVGQDCNVFWQVGSSATLGTTTEFKGTIVADQSITLITGANVAGRALARNGAVTMDTNVITSSSCSLPPSTSAPTLSKSFSPATIIAGGVSTLTITLSNPNPSAADLTEDLIDYLPSGMVIASAPASTTCIGTEDVLATAGASTVTLPATMSIPGGTPGTCTVTVNVTSATEGSYDNTLAANALQTSNGNNAEQAQATLTVNPIITPPGGQASISGMKFNDSNNNGINDGGEEGLAGWIINYNGPVSGSTTTDSSGKYSFTDLPSGTYTVSETQQGGWIQTTPASPGTHTVVLGVTTDVIGIDFGNYKTSQTPPPPVPELPTLLLTSAGVFGLLLMWRKRMV